VALYLYSFGFDPVVNAAVLLVLSGLVFLRTGYVYPTRTPALRTVTISLSIVWGAMIVWIVLALPHPPRVLVFASLFFPVYYAGLSFLLNQRRTRPA
jgi:phosphatidylserine synthase